MKLFSRPFPLQAAMVVGAVCLACASAMAAAATPKCALYFYNEAASAAPVGVTIDGKSKVAVKPIAPGKLSGPIALPELKAQALPASELKMLKQMGMAPPGAAPVITFHAKGGDTAVEIVPTRVAAARSHDRAFVFVVDVPRPDAAPRATYSALFEVTEDDYRDARAGKALIAIADDMPISSNADDNARSVFLRSADGALQDVGGGGLAGVGATTALAPGRYDILRHATVTAEKNLTTARAKSLPAIAHIARAGFHPGHIAIYIVPKPGTLEHVMDLTPP